MSISDRLRRSDPDTSNGNRRYAEGGGFDAEEMLEPGEFRDSKRLSWGERLYRLRRHLISGGFLLFAALLVVAGYSRILIPELYGNMAIRIAGVSLFGGSVLVAFGMAIQRTVIFGIGKETFKINDQTIALYGEHVETPDGELAFEPIRGFDMFGLRKNTMTLGDLGRRYPNLLSKRMRESDSPARLRLTDGLHSDSETWLGREGVTHTSELRKDTYGKHTDVYAAPPDTVDETEYTELSNEVEKVHDQNQFLKQRVDELETDRDELATELKKRRGEVRDDLKETFKLAGEVQRHSRARPRRDERTDASLPDDKEDSS